jgi:hypothetical protein
MNDGRLASRLDSKIWLAAASSQTDWRRCFKIACETFRYSAKCRGIRRINVAFILSFVYRPLYVYNMFTTFTKVADFLMSSQFLVPLAPVIDSSGLPKKFRGAIAPAASPKYQQSVVWSTLPSLLIFFFLFPPFSSILFHASFHFSLHPIPIGADFLKKSHGAKFHCPPSPFLPFFPL